MSFGLLRTRRSLYSKSEYSACARLVKSCVTYVFLPFQHFASSKRNDCQEFGGSFANCIDSANFSAAGLVNLITESFDCFRDETVFHGKRVRLYKRAQILVADLWACFNGEDFGEFNDIDKITMFAGRITISTTIPFNC